MKNNPQKAKTISKVEQTQCYTQDSQLLQYRIINFGAFIYAYRNVKEFCKICAPFLATRPTLKSKQNKFIHLIVHMLRFKY